MSRPNQAEKMLNSITHDEHGRALPPAPAAPTDGGLLNAIVEQPTPKPATLWDITDEMLRINDLLEQCDGDISDPRIEDRIVAALDGVQDARSKKIDSYCWLIRRLEAEAVAMKAERDRFAARASSREKRVEFLKARLFGHMNITGTAKIETDAFTVSIANNGGKLPMVMDEAFSADMLPPEYVRLVPEADNAAIRADLEKGKQLAFARLGERGKSLRIR